MSPGKRLPAEHATKSAPYASGAPQANASAIEQEFEAYLRSIAAAYAEPVVDAFAKREQEFLDSLARIQARQEKDARAALAAHQGLVDALRTTGQEQVTAVTKIADHATRDFTKRQKEFLDSLARIQARQEKDAREAVAAHQRLVDALRTTSQEQVVAVTKIADHATRDFANKVGRCLDRVDAAVGSLTGTMDACLSRIDERARLWETGTERATHELREMLEDDRQLAAQATASTRRLLFSLVGAALLFQVAILLILGTR